MRTFFTLLLLVGASSVHFLCGCRDTMPDPRRPNGAGDLEQRPEDIGRRLEVDEGMVKEGADPAVSVVPEPMDEAMLLDELERRDRGYRQLLVR
jgi:hypothetical protein